MYRIERKVRNPYSWLSMHASHDLNRPPPPRHVFEDQSGKRFRVIIFIMLVLLLVLLGFAAEFAYRVYSLKPANVASPVYDPDLKPDMPAPPAAETLSVVIKPSAYTDCGQGLLDFTSGTATLAGYVPFDDATALAGLRAHCRDLGVVYYQAFGFGTPDGRLRALGPLGAGFPLPAFNTGLISRNRPRGFPVLTPDIGTPAETLAQIFTAADSGGQFMPDLRALDLTGVDGGICLDLTAYPDMRADDLLPLFSSLSDWLAPLGLQTCLIGAMDAGFWQNAALVAKVDQPVVLGFQAPTSPATPVAPPAWFESAARSALQQIAPEKLSVALGSFSTLWKSGQRRPESIPFAEAMLRAQFFDGTVRFSAQSGNSHARYLDENRQLNQIWVLDAASYYNQRQILGAAPQVTLWPLGYEDPAIWALAEEPSAVAAIAAEIDLSDHISVEGAGPFSTHIARAISGRRTATLSAETGLITQQEYLALPSPRRIRLFGESGDLELALAFYGLGSARQSEILLAELARRQISATFFLSTNDLLLSKTTVENLMAAAHSIGTDITPRTSSTLFGGAFSTLQNNLAQQLLQDEFGHHALLVKNPSRYGQFPGDRAVLDQLQDLQSAGYLAVYSNLSAPFGRIDPEEFVQTVRRTALTASGNVLGFDFSEQNDDAVNAALPAILDTLQQDGFSFIGLPEIAGFTPAQAFPPSSKNPALRDQVIYGVMAATWIGIQNFIFLLALIVALRSPIYLFLAFMWRDKYPFDPAYQPRVTVIIPAYNEAKVIRKTMRSVLASDYAALQVIVVDDGSNDDTAAVVAAFAKQDSRITLIEQSNHGKWFAEDTALCYVDTPIFVIVDADTLLHKDAIKYLVQPFRDRAVGAVAGTVEIGNRDNVITACQVIEYKISQSVMRRAYEVFNGILVVPGAIGAWRTDAVVASGLVSGDTITEDADLTVAIHRSDFKVVYAPKALSYTEAPNSVSAFMQQRLRWSLGMLQVAWKHRGAVIEGRAVGFISILDAVWYRIISSFIYPLVDLIIISTVLSWGYTIATQGSIGLNDLSTSAILLFILLTLLDMTNLVAAFWFERKIEWKLLVLVPFLRFGYRQMLYISSMRSIFHAVSGRLRGWQKLKRTDTAHM